MMGGAQRPGWFGGEWRDFSLRLGIGWFDVSRFGLC